MTSRRWSLLVVIAALSFSGCRMCCPSYDYCGPTEPGESNSEYCGMARAGSIFSNAPVYSGGEYVEGEEIVDGETIIEEQAEPVKLQPPAPPTMQKTTRRTR